MKDNLTLIAAATGGFILSVALAGILRGAPITAWQEQSSFRTTTVANLQRAELKAAHLKIGDENNLHSIE
ncbi:MULTISPECIES: hypothetical protein [unclassified Nostoc]|uniref:Uncharacterized protein n=1 Tax=Nostoc punctiforme NIES-2108 TaxID=1356359 RepID=A0A367RKC0_NOSPU|nr:MULTISPECIES: hypothetical protein [unclassified Nostoc]RCJ36064.1 hypothetical protein A6769_17275 [Nostoc punctiforme NIES-2108]MBN3876022.1 hypothetical protein [Nostoc sp. JL23]MBN3889209.1 hypothetical protein [Nostoc sp. JL31]OYD97810.1 hypothetical protein CDG76_02930 [Nostoc sp. 'Peltigera membranacea cyanobiont' 210A]PHM07050.1 hypothetical protein CK516_29510 [Nostoc sp. 'Peltigera malacea cyanobiont' DB3992]